jgi:uncharacterized protein (TIGR03086 family)
MDPDTNAADTAQPDLLGLYEQASSWTAAKVAAAAQQLGAPTPCEKWDVRTLLDHMLETQEYFAGAARGDDVSPPGQQPPALAGDDPAAAFEQHRSATIEAYSQPGAIERTGPALGIAFSDQLLHGWDLAKATGQDATMPDGLAQTAFDLIHGRFTDDQREGVFGPEVPVGADASAQDRLLAYTGRDPRA